MKPIIKTLIKAEVIQVIQAIYMHIYQSTLSTYMII